MGGGDMLRHALAYARRGISVFPCAPDGKLPAIPKDKGGRGVLDATTDEGRIRAWWGHMPQANIGAAAGATHWLLDIDGEDGEASVSAMEAEHGALPPTVELITPSGGRHLWWQPIDGLRNTARTVAAGVDTRAHGGYGLVPPSVVKGRAYVWSVDTADKIAAAPDWLVTLVSVGVSAGGDAGAGGGAMSRFEWAAGEVIGEGRRNDTLARIAGVLLRRSVSVQLVWDLLHAFNAQRCAPPLDGKELTTIVDSIAGRELKRRRDREARRNG